MGMRRMARRLRAPMHIQVANQVSTARDELVVSRVNHCDLRDSEGLAVIGPAERCCPAVVVVDEGDDLVGQVVE